MRISLKNIIIPSIPLAILLVISCFGLWFSSFLGGRFGTMPTQNSLAIDNLQALFTPNTLQSNLFSFVLTLLNAFLIAQINNRFTVIRTRTFLPIFIFLLLMSSWTETHIVNGSHSALTLIIFSLFFFLNMYRDRNASEMAFMGSLFISIAAIIIHPLVFLIPVCWLGFMIYQSFSFRTFLASVFGAITPWIIYLSIYYLFNHQITFSEVFSIDFSFNYDYSTISLARIIFTGVLFLIMVICTIGMYSTSNNDAIRTRNNLNFLLLMLVATFILSITFANQFTLLLPIIALFVALLASHPFTLKQNNFFGILFIVFYLLNIALIASKYFVF